MEKLFAPSQQQIIVLSIWALLAVLLINYGGRNNDNYTKVVQTGFRLIVVGVFGAAALLLTGSEQNTAFTSAATNFMLILSAAVGANYISHAKMSLRKPDAEAATPQSAAKTAPTSRSGKGRPPKNQHK